MRSLNTALAFALSLNTAAAVTAAPMPKAPSGKLVSINETSAYLCVVSLPFCLPALQVSTLTQQSEGVPVIQYRVV